LTIFKVRSLIPLQRDRKQRGIRSLSIFTLSKLGSELSDYEMEVRNATKRR